MLPAAAFIDVAEEVGLAPELSRITLEAGCAALAEWRTMGFDTRVRINVAAAQLQTGDLDVSVAAALERHAIPADRLCVEITERSLMLDIDASAAALRQLRRMGVEVAIDDFGTGFSSLAWLQGLPVDTLKIDRSFVAGLTGGRTDRNIVSTIVNLADAVGLEVVAEGVETEQQAVMLTDLGCHRAQGWLWWGALPADEIPRLLLENSISPAARPDDPLPLPHPGVDR
jgi:EAL domain-containing protein (putative c-di-GMP-specific phosphodiesterase class I)